MRAPIISQKDRHIGEAYANYKRFLTLRANRDYQWAAILLFYSAIHLIDACHAHYHPTERLNNHSERNDYVRYDEPKRIKRDYDYMYIVSIQLRYELQVATTVDLDDFYKHFEIVQEHLRDQHNIAWQLPVVQAPVNRPTTP